MQNAISFLEVQDGMLETTGKIIDRMSELKGLGESGSNEECSGPCQLQQRVQGPCRAQLYDISQMKFNGVSYVR